MFVSISTNTLTVLLDDYGSCSLARSFFAEQGVTQCKPHLDLKGSVPRHSQ